MRTKSLLERVINYVLYHYLKFFRKYFEGAGNVVDTFLENFHHCLIRGSNRNFKFPEPNVYSIKKVFKKILISQLDIMNVLYILCTFLILFRFKFCTFKGIVSKVRKINNTLLI